MNQKSKKSHSPRIIAAVFLFLCICAAFLLTTRRISSVATESCFRTLSQSTGQLCRELRNNVASNETLMESYADQIALLNEIDSGKAVQLLSSFKGDGPLTHLEIFFPDGRLLRADGTFAQAPETFSFEKEAAENVHISGRENNPEDESMILRVYAPIVKAGHTQALLCGIIDLAKILDFYTLDSFPAHSRLYVIEGESGNFLVDTVHPELGNVKDLGRRTKPGYDISDVISDMHEGTAGRASFYSHTYGEYLYCDYAPAGISDWMVLFSLPESIAMADANKTRGLLILLAFLEGASLVCYFLWLLRRLKKENVEKEGQLHRAEYILDIEQTLFGASRNPGLIQDALEKAADALTAQSAFLVAVSRSRGSRTYAWHSPDTEAEQLRMDDSLSERLLALGTSLKKSEHLLSYDLHELSEKYGMPEPSGIHSLMLIPVLDSDNLPVGVLGAANMAHRWEHAELLECVMLSFSMALNNIEAFGTIREMGMIDHLTGLLNRNSFQAAMELHENTADDSLACLYVDADGLHELNNHCGHVSGDEMLKTVADSLAEEFGREDTYRIGGDEFVVFCRGLSEDQIRKKTQNLEQSLASNGYHISVGIEWRRTVPLVYDLVQQAETNMYEAKRGYYESRDTVSQAREMNRRLEELLSEKRDLDVFRSALASKYLGVYIVSLKLDTTRSIYIPSYFKKLIEEAGGKFSVAIKDYIHENVTPQYQEEFWELTDYKELQRRLDRGDEPELRYWKTDGTYVLLRIYRSPEYSWRIKDCIWSFENLEAPEEKPC